MVGTSFAVAWAQNGTAAALSGFSALRRELWLKVQEQADDGYRAVLRIEAALRPHARLYDYAAGLFRRRADVVVRTTGVRLLCDDAR